MRLLLVLLLVLAASEKDRARIFRDVRDGEWADIHRVASVLPEVELSFRAEVEDEQGIFQHDTVCLTLTLARRAAAGGGKDEVVELKELSEAELKQLEADDKRRRAEEAKAEAAAEREAEQQPAAALDAADAAGADAAGEEADDSKADSKDKAESKEKEGKEKGGKEGEAKPRKARKPRRLDDEEVCRPPLPPLTVPGADSMRASLCAARA